MEETPGPPPAEKNPNDPAGYCTMWSLMFIDWRLTNPHVPANRLQEELIRRCNDDDELPLDLDLSTYFPEEKCSTYLRRLIRGFAKDVFARLFETMRTGRTSGQAVMEKYVGIRRRSLAYEWDNSLPQITAKEVAWETKTFNELADALQRYTAEVTAG